MKEKCAHVMALSSTMLLAHAHTDQVQCIASGLHKKADNKTEVKF